MSSEQALALRITLHLKPHLQELSEEVRNTLTRLEQIAANLFGPNASHILETIRAVGVAELESQGFPERPVPFLVGPISSPPPPFIEAMVQQQIAVRILAYPSPPVVLFAEFEACELPTRSSLPEAIRPEPDSLQISIYSLHINAIEAMVDHLHVCDMESVRRMRLTDAKDLLALQDWVFDKSKSCVKSHLHINWNEDSRPSYNLLGQFTVDYRMDCCEKCRKYRLDDWWDQVCQQHEDGGMYRQVEMHANFLSNLRHFGSLT